MELSDLSNRFSFHKVDFSGADYMNEIRIECYRVSIIINRHVPDSREKSLAITKLEEVMFWANAGISRSRKHAAIKEERKGEDNQDPDEVASGR